MRSVNLQAVRARVERLAADCPVDRLFLISWEQGDHNQCQACGFDLLAHVQAEAKRAAAPGARYVWVGPTHALTECPQCGNPHPACADMPK